MMVYFDLITGETVEYDDPIQQDTKRMVMLSSRYLDYEIYKVEKELNKEFKWWKLWVTTNFPRSHFEYREVKTYRLTDDQYEQALTHQVYKEL